MPRFVVSVSEPASEQLEDLPVEVKLPLLRKIQVLGESPFPRGTTIKRLKTRPALYRLRHSDYRAVYRIKEIPRTLWTNADFLRSFVCVRLLGLRYQRLRTLIVKSPKRLHSRKGE
jgi:mRNA-degrading endonuclease RelE of RelBE toxin-antitoxin system